MPGRRSRAAFPLPSQPHFPPRARQALQSPNATPRPPPFTLSPSTSACATPPPPFPPSTSRHAPYSVVAVSARWSTA
eukprot:110629-Chlamydomonas_euryale.AAC.1